MRIAVAGDHHGVTLKGRLTAWLVAAGRQIDDQGTHSAGEVDDPPLRDDVCAQVVIGAADRGLVLGGSGAGEAIACTKVRGIRAGLCHDVWGTQISRGNNDSNVLVLGVKVVSADVPSSCSASGWRPRSRRGSTGGGWT